MPVERSTGLKMKYILTAVFLTVVVALSGCTKTVEQMKDERDVEGLIKALESTDEEKRAKAAEALGELEDTRAIDPLIKLLRSDDSSIVRQKVSEALVKMGMQATPRLVEALDDDDWRVRSQIAWILGEIGDSRAVPYLIKQINDSVRDVRKNVVWALGQIGVDARAVDPLFNALKDEDPGVRSEARTAIVKMGESAVNRLIQSLNDEDEFIRNTSAWALGEIGGRRGTSFETRKKMAEPLVKSLRDEDEDVRKSVALSLDKLRFEPRNEEEQAWYFVAKREWDKAAFLGSVSVDPLILALRAEVSDVKWGATKALVKIGNSAVQPLMRALQDEEIQIQAVIALEIIGTTEAKEAVNDFIDKYDADLEYMAQNYNEILEQVNISGYEFLLILALERYGDNNMLSALIESGNPILEYAASYWAERHGHVVLQEKGSPKKWP